MLDELTTLAVAPEELEAWSGSLRTCYCAIFGGPRWDAPEQAAGAFTHRLRLKASFNGFRMVLALAEGSRLVGFAYGAASFGGALEPSYAWLARALGPKVTHTALLGAFEVMDLGVVPWAREHGVGSRLHDDLLRGIVYERAWLMTRADATTARTFYQRRGWLELGSVHLPTSVPRLVMTRTLVNN